MGITALNLLVQYRYIVILPLTVIEGPIVMLTTGFLYSMGYFSIVPLIISLMIGDLIGDILWYSIGYFGGMKFVVRFGKYFSVTPESIEKVKKIFDNHHSKILFISKITMGFGFALVTLFTAGLTRVPFGRYLIFNIVGGFVWTGILVTVGYYLGSIYLTIGKGFEIVTIIAGIIILSAIFYGFGKYVKSVFNKQA